MSSKIGRGVGVALVTPFTEKGKVDFETLEKLVDFQIENGTQYLVCLGTTAETPTLSQEERHKIVRCIVKRNAGRVPTIVGIGGNNTAAVCETLHTFDFSGINAVLSVTPCYNKPSQEGLFRHYVALSNASPLPIILYNVPSRTGVNISAETTLRIARECENVIGIKEASGNMEQIKKIIADCNDDFRVISGDDSMALSVIQSGGSGVISVLANAFPKQFSQLIQLALSGEMVRAKEMAHAFHRTFSLLFADGNPAGVKCYLHAVGRINNILRLPLVPVCENVRQQIYDDLKNMVQ